MQQDLSNARIIEWESTEERGFEFTRLVEVAHVARREARGATFREGGTYYTEQQAAELGARVVAEFPRPSLAEVVGDAPAFKYDDYLGERCLAFRNTGGGWHTAIIARMKDGCGLSDLTGVIPDLSTVVPLVPREVVS